MCADTPTKKEKEWEKQMQRKYLPIGKCCRKSNEKSYQTQQ
jgi:hypothetical protein